MPLYWTGVLRRRLAGGTHVARSDVRSVNVGTVSHRWWPFDREVPARPYIPRVTPAAAPRYDAAGQWRAAPRCRRLGLASNSDVTGP